MKQCNKCGKAFPCKVLVDGKKRNISNRKFCLECSPFGQHNTSSYPADTTGRPQQMVKECRHHGLTDFVKEKRGAYRCLRCRREAVIEFRRNAKRKLIELLGGACCCCGYNRCVTSMHFHHLDPKTKEFNISHPSTKKWEKLLKEAAKCRLVCANCHGEIEEGIRKLD